MAVKLRLRRMGAKRRPYYRIVAADSRSPRDGRFIEVVGNYNPILKEADQLTLDEEKVMNWLSKGAQPTDTVKNLLTKKGLMAKFNNSKAPKKVAKKATVKKEEVKEKPVAKKTTTKKTTTKKAAK